MLNAFVLAILPVSVLCASPISPSSVPFQSCVVWIMIVPLLSVCVALLPKFAMVYSIASLYGLCNRLAKSTRTVMSSSVFIDNLSIIELVIVLISLKTFLLGLMKGIFLM